MSFSRTETISFEKELARSCLAVQTKLASRLIRCNCSSPVGFGELFLTLLCLVTFFYATSQTWGWWRFSLVSFFFFKKKKPRRKQPISSVKSPSLATELLSLRGAFLWLAAQGTLEVERSRLQPLTALTIQVQDLCSAGICLFSPRGSL